jgi:hypothetical protein
MVFLIVGGLSRVVILPPRIKMHKLAYEEILFGMREGSVYTLVIDGREFEKESFVGYVYFNSDWYCAVFSNELRIALINVKSGKYNRYYGDKCEIFDVTPQTLA